MTENAEPLEPDDFDQLEATRGNTSEGRATGIECFEARAQTTARPSSWIANLRRSLAAVQGEAERLSATARRALDKAVETLNMALPTGPPGPAVTTSGGAGVDTWRGVLGHDPHVLLVGTNACDLETLFTGLSGTGGTFRLTLVRDARAAKQSLVRTSFDLVVYEYDAPDLSVIHDFTDLQALPACPPIIFVAAEGNEDLAAAAFKAGAYDYIPRREMSLLVLRRSVAQALRRLRLERELEAANQRLAELVNRDPLTRLHNRRCFESRLAAEFARAERFEHPLALVLLDVDHFKDINDSFGHPTGDRVLIEVGRCMLEKSREIDLVARIGGEEFALLLPNTTAAGAVSLAGRIITRVRAQGVPAGDRIATITVSAGVAAFPEFAAKSRMELFEAADQALYKAKESGRNQIARYGGW